MDQLSKKIISDIYKEFRADSGLNIFRRELNALPLTVGEKLDLIEAFRGTVVEVMNQCFNLMIEEIKAEARQGMN